MGRMGSLRICNFMLEVISGSVNGWQDPLAALMQPISLLTLQSCSY